MNIELTAPTSGRLIDHIASPPALPICFDSAEGVSHPSHSKYFDGLNFVAEVNALAWGQCGEIYQAPRQEEMNSEWANVGHTIPEVLSKWRNYGLFGTNIEGWFTLDYRDTDSILRAIALFGFVVASHSASAPGTLCGFHRNLGVHQFGCIAGIPFANFNQPLAVYVVMPTIYVETDHPSTQYIKYETLETE